VTIIRLFADDQRLSVVAGPKIASGDRNSVQIQVSFSGNWSRYQKSAVFYTSRDRAVYEVLLEDSKCTVPHEVLAKTGDLYIGIRGVAPGVGSIKTSTIVKYRVEKGAPVGDATSVEPTPDVYEQILAKLEKISGGVTEEEVTKIVDAHLKNNSPASIGWIDLLADRWTGGDNLHSQVVTVAGVTPNSQVDITPSVEDLVVFYEKDLTLVTENDGGVVTVYAIGQRPTHDYRFQVTITEVSL
jgi:hypothetical protein